MAVVFRQEFPFFTLTSFPPGFLVHVGGVVSARSVKLLDRIHNPGELNTPTHLKTQSTLMFFVHCPFKRCDLSFINLQYRVSVQSRWNSCPLSFSVWLEFNLFREVVERLCCKCESCLGTVLNWLSSSHCNRMGHSSATWVRKFSS